MAGVPVALYVIDVDGSGLLRLAGRESGLPERIDVALGLGEESPRRASRTSTNT